MYEKEYFVHVYDTGADGNLSLYGFFNYLQDIAAEHANKLGFGRDDLMKGNVIWVLSRIYAEISAWPAWEEQLIVKTWHKGSDRLFGLRDFLISRRDGTPIGAATSSWAVIDLESRKIQRPDQILSPPFCGARAQNALPRNAGKVEAAAAGAPLKPLHTVRISDLDVNLHANNTKYLQWTIDSYDIDFITRHLPRSVEINFLAESRLGDDIAIRTSAAADHPLSLNHSIVRTADDTELTRMRMAWNERA